MRKNIEVLCLLMFCVDGVSILTHTGRESAGYDTDSQERWGIHFSHLVLFYMVANPNCFLSQRLGWTLEFEAPAIRLQILTQSGCYSYKALWKKVVTVKGQCAHNNCLFAFVWWIWSRMGEIAQYSNTTQYSNTILSLLYLHQKLVFARTLAPVWFAKVLVAG